MNVRIISVANGYLIYNDDAAYQPGSVRCTKENYIAKDIVEITSVLEQIKNDNEYKKAILR